ncbi:unnamed protein product [Phytophthora fragariaefolia]|uniref:Unnamed protein product n=1 Tax=Phytophthora fragariaefolia TaxID=1490495 RepID=A0A9W7CXU3_9STRA|nr:unnamed protein product [Phytophthora fragariaefolia]
MLCLLGLYVDDILIVSQDAKISDLVMTQLAERFNIKDLDEARKCLGAWIDYTASGIAVHQHQATLDLLAKVGLDQCNAWISTTAISRKMENHCKTLRCIER